MRYILAAAFALGLAAPASAFVVRECGPEFSPVTISEPWEEYSRAYANGVIRIFEILIDPNVASGAAIGVLHPSPPEDGSFRTCSAIYLSDDFRFFGQAFIAEAQATYDAARGLVISVPVQVLGEGGRRVVTFAVNQATGLVSLQ